MITQERLKYLLTYHDDLGVFTWNFRTGRSSAESIAGTLHHTGYDQIRVDYKSYRAHRLVWLYEKGRFPKSPIDHIDRNKTNNRISNLREVTQATNSRNKGLNKNNKSGFSGVCKRETLIGLIKWEVSVGGKYYGSFQDLEFASLVASEVYSKLGYHENHGR